MDWETIIVMAAVSFSLSVTGVILASRLNYRYLQKLGKKDILGALLESDEAKEIFKLVHNLNLFIESPEAKTIKQNLLDLLSRIGQVPKEEDEPDVELPRPEKYST